MTTVSRPQIPWESATPEKYFRGFPRGLRSLTDDYGRPSAVDGLTDLQDACLL